MKNSPFQRDTCEDEQASCIEDLNNIAFFGERMSGFAAKAVEAVERGDPETAMRYVQRVRFLCQMRADIAELLLDDLHFLATGNEDFDHEAWLAAQGERDYDALTFATCLATHLDYMTGEDIAGGRDE